MRRVEGRASPDETERTGGTVRGQPLPANPPNRGNMKYRYEAKLSIIQQHNNPHSTLPLEEDEAEEDEEDKDEHEF